VGWNAIQLNSVHIHLFRYADLLLLLAEAEAQAGTLGNALTYLNLVRARAGVAAQGCGGAFTTATRTVLDAVYPGCVGHSELAVPLDDPTIGWATYKVTPYAAGDVSTPAAMLRAIRIERRLELAMEGQRFFDLRRYGEPYVTAVMNAYLTRERLRRSYKTAQLPFLTKNMYFPITQTQIDLSKIGGEDRLHQNPSW
jgi:hypothetical protein